MFLRFFWTRNDGSGSICQVFGVVFLVQIFLLGLIHPSTVVSL